MGHITLTGNPAVEIKVRRSARARRLSLRVSRLDGRVTMTLPTHVSDTEARKFANAKSRWILKTLDDHAAPIPVSPGTVLPVEGRERVVVDGKPAQITAAEIKVPGARAGKATEALLKHMARDRLVSAVERYADALGRPFGRITLRDTRSRWGSCSSEGNLMFSWRLILAAPDVLDYVAAHEVAHLARMDHSPEFWAHVADLCPGYETPRAWLRREGHALHRYRFS